MKLSRSFSINTELIHRSFWVRVCVSGQPFLCLQKSVWFLKRPSQELISFRSVPLTESCFRLVLELFVAAHLVDLLGHVLNMQGNQLVQV